MSWLRNDGAHRVEAGVGLVEEQDLGVEHQGPGQAGALAHAAGDLAGELVLGADEADEVHLLHDDVAHLGLGLLGVLAQREGDVVVEVHRAEHRAVLEQDAEELADLVEVPLRAARDVGALDEDRALVGLDEADEGLEEDRLAGAGGAEHHADLAGRDRQADVAPDQLLAERLGEVVDLDLHAHAATSLCLGDARTTVRGTASPRRSLRGDQRGRRREVTREIAGASRGVRRVSLRVTISRLPEVTERGPQPARRRRISALMAGTTSCRSPITACVALVTIGASGSVLIARIALALLHPAQCWMAPLIPQGM